VSLYTYISIRKNFYLRVGEHRLRRVYRYSLLLCIYINEAVLFPVLLDWFSGRGFAIDLTTRVYHKPNSPTPVAD